MFVYRNGFYLVCKAKDLKCRLADLGSPDTKVARLIRLHLN